jgi:methionyl-tRNA formyltransferase
VQLIDPSLCARCVICVMRIVSFNVFPPAYEVVNTWAAECGHDLVLVVTTPGPTSRRNTSYQRVISSVPPGTDILVTTRLRKVALPLVRALEPDLIVSFTFPYRIPPEVIALSRFGAVNLHPTALPAYRGPNPLRGIYEGFPLLGATLHWTAAEYDTGNVLSQHTGPMPEVVTPESILENWLPLIRNAFAEGTARAVAGETGTPQDDEQSSYGAKFTDEEHWLTPLETRMSFQSKCAALNFFGPAAMISLHGRDYTIDSIDQLDDITADPPGTITQQTSEAFVLQVLDGRVLVRCHSFQP